MGFMIPVYHAFEITDRAFPNGTEIDMHKHEEGNNETDKNMKKIGQMKSTQAEYIGRNNIRVHQR